jgi:hypothetical protein
MAAVHQVRDDAEHVHSRAYGRVSIRCLMLLDMNPTSELQRDGARGIVVGRGVVPCSIGGVCRIRLGPAGRTGCARRPRCRRLVHREDARDLVAILVIDGDIMCAGAGEDDEARDQEKERGQRGHCGRGASEGEQEWKGNVEGWIQGTATSNRL